MGWIGVDLDGTIAEYGEWIGPNHIGNPVPLMVDRVKAWIKSGWTVKIVTARVYREGPRSKVREAIDSWCLEHIGQVLEVTCEKDYDMVELWDDRAVQVVKNTGVRADGLP